MIECQQCGDKISGGWCKCGSCGVIDGVVYEQIEGDSKIV